MTKIFDNRVHSDSVNFNELPFGAYYQDEDGDINVKFSNDESLYYDVRLKKWFRNEEQADKEVIPLEVSITIDYCKDNKE